MDQEATNVCRVLRPVGALFQADQFLAEWRGNEGLKKLFALWQVRPELCTPAETVELLLEDLRRAAQLSSPLVTHILDLWWQDKDVAFAVECHPGMTLAQVSQRLQERQQSMPLELVLWAVLETAHALQLAHRDVEGQGAVVHGDLRPQNILLGFDGSVKVTGWGFARFLPALEPRGQYCTWDGRCYQPGERLEPAEFDPRSDIFSLGLVLWHALTGARPYGTDDREALFELLEKRASPVPDGELNLSEGLTVVVRRACAPQPRDRYQDVAELAQDISELLFQLGRGLTSGPGEIRAVLGQLTEASGEDEERSPGGVRRAASHHASLVAEGRIPDVLPAECSLRVPIYQLVGRQEALSAVAEALNDTVRGEGRGVLFEAEPGMGRTRVLDEVGLRLCRSAFPRAWLHVRAQAAEQCVGFSGILRLLAPLVGLGTSCDLLEVGQRAEHLRLYGVERPSIAAIRSFTGAGAPPSSGRLRELLSQGVLTALAQVVSEQTTVVAWDDLQWTDDGSRYCLRELFARLGEIPLVALLTTTPDDASNWADGRLDRVALRPFSLAESEDWVRELVLDVVQVEPELLAFLQQHTGGNPLSMLEAVEVLQEEGRLVLEQGCLKKWGSDEAPVLDLRAVMQQHLDGMGRKVSQVALASALAGPALRDDIVAAATDLDSAIVREAITLLVDHYRLLCRENQRVTFAQERHRRAMIAAAPEPVIERLSVAVGWAILESTEPGSALDDAAAELLMAGGERVIAADLLLSGAERCEAVGDIEGALLRYSKAWDLARQTEELSPEFVVQVTLGGGRAAVQCGKYAFAAEALTEAARVAGDREDLRTAAKAETLLLSLLARQGELEASIERAKNVIPLIESTGDPLLLAQGYAAIAEAYHGWGRYGPDFRHLEAAVRFAAKVRDVTELTRVLELAVRHAAGVGETSQAKVLLDHARFVAQKVESGQLSSAISLAEGQLYLFQGKYAKALRSAREGLTVASSRGLADQEIQLFHLAGHACLRQEQWSEAAYAFGESYRLAKAVRFDALARASGMYVGFIEATRLGQPQGLELVKAVLKQTTGAGSSSWLWWGQQANSLLGMALLLQDRPQDARAFFLEALRLAQESGVRFLIDESEQYLTEAEAASLELDRDEKTMS